MSDMFWIALELSISKIVLNLVLSLTVKKLDAFKFDGVAESDNTAVKSRGIVEWPFEELRIFAREKRADIFWARSN